MPKSVVIIVNYNDYEDVICLIRKVENYELIEKIIVVDNASTDASYAELTAAFSDHEQVRILQMENNVGYARGNNYGMRYALENFSFQYFVIANPDVRFEEFVLARLCELFEQGDEKIGLATARMCSDKSYGGCGVWKQPSFGDLCFNNFILLKKIFGDRTDYQEKELCEDINRVDVIAGSFFVCRASVMQNVGFFDEYTFLYGEENILAYKLGKSGYYNLMCSSMQYEHKHSTSIDKSISSVCMKFDWLYDSLSYYNKEYLKTNGLQRVLFYLSFKIGLYSYVLAKKIFNIWNKEKNYE